MYLESDQRAKLDHIFANSAKGIVAYGIMPSALIFLGALKLEQIHLPSDYGWLEVIAILIIVSIPLMVLYFILHRRLERYYLFKDYLPLRTIILTFEILFIVTIIGLASGYLTGTFMFSANLDSWISPLLYSLLGGIATLSISSTLFATLLTEDVDLPGLPSKEYMVCLSERKKLVAGLMAGRFAIAWSKKPVLDDKKQTLETLDKLRSKINNLRSTNDMQEMQTLLNCIEKDIENLAKALNELSAMNLDSSWQKYFSDDEKLKRDQNENLMMLSVQRFLTAKWSKR